MLLQILPSIDLRDGKVVRLKQGDYARQVNYDVDPVATAQSFKQAGASWLHLVDLDGAKDGRPAQTALIARIIAVGDTFDAMTSDRLYQKAMDDDFVIKTLTRLSGTRYDPKMVQAFIKAHPKLGSASRAAAAPAPQPA